MDLKKIVTDLSQSLLRRRAASPTSMPILKSLGDKRADHLKTRQTPAYRPLKSYEPRASNM
ncbi:hypothetical protein HB777_24035 [Mesorhizobium loti]|nr:hypothetical protein HB777_24035 [Mesorhizobium loti]